MPKAVWNGAVLAECERTILVEGNHYFPPDALHLEYFRPGTMHTTCPWKGLASYYSVEVDGQTNLNAAWYYPAPKAGAAQISGYIAFWKGVKVEP